MAEPGGRGGTFRARKPTATFMTARGASGVSYIKKQSFAENNTKQIGYCGCDCCMGVKNGKGYELYNLDGFLLSWLHVAEFCGGSTALPISFCNGLEIEMRTKSAVFLFIDSGSSVTF